MKNQDKMYDELVDLRDQLECMEEDNDSLDLVLENIFFCLDSMRGGYDMTEEAAKCVIEAKHVLRGGTLLAITLKELVNRK